MPVSDFDILRVAKQVLDRHGAETEVYAVQQADRFLDPGDLDS